MTTKLCSVFRAYIVGCILFFIGCHSVLANSLTWPNGAKAAVVLTYDDTLDSHLDHAIPQLNKAKLTGTFYVSGAREQLSERMEEWRAAAASGHELGNHMLHHPCKKSNPGRDWVANYYDLDRYTIAQFEEELKVTNTLLQAIDGKRRRTFAYPCGDTDVGGGDSVIPTLKKHVTGARFASTPVNTMSEGATNHHLIGIDNPLTFDRFMINAMDGSAQTGDQLISAAQNSISSGSIMTFLFHGVIDKGEYLATSTKAHQELVNHLKDNPTLYWVAPLQDVLDHIDNQTLGK